MIRKPIILIMSSRDERGYASQKLKEAIKAIGSHNVVVVSDDKYGSIKKTSTMDRLMDSGQEYQYLLDTKDKGVAKDLLKVKKFSKRVIRIVNLLKRYRPEYILCMTPFAHNCAVEAKRRAKFHTQIIYYMNSFTTPKTNFDSMTNVIIVENSDIKQDLVRAGVKSKQIMTLGLPYDLKKLPEKDVNILKQEVGLPDTKSVFIKFNNKKILDEIFDLMVDQGGIVNLCIYTEDEKEREILKNRAEKIDNMTILFVQNKELVDLYLCVCDLAITEFDPSIIYKSFKVGLPSIVLDGGEQSKKDIQYLMNKGLLLRAKEPMDVVALLYKVLNTEEGKEIAECGQKWVEAHSVNEIAQFLVSYIVV